MNNNHACIVCMGSNKDGDVHMDNARKSLAQLFHEVRTGDQIVTVAEGNVKQSDYLNQAVRFITCLGISEVVNLLKQIEKENGRTADDKHNGSVPLDIDLLIYDDRVLKAEDLDKKYVKDALRSLPEYA